MIWREKWEGYHLGHNINLDNGELKKLKEEPWMWSILNSKPSKQVKCMGNVAVMMSGMCKDTNCSILC